MRKFFLLIFPFLLAASFCFTSHAADSSYYINLTDFNNNVRSYTSYNFPEGTILAAYYNGMNSGYKQYFIISNTSSSLRWSYAYNNNHINNSSVLNDFLYQKSVDTNIPLFESKAEAQDYIITGGHDIIEDDSFYLKDFDNPNSTLFTWNGISYNPLDVGILDFTNTYVAIYFYEAANSSDRDNFEIDETSVFANEYFFNAGFNYSQDVFYKLQFRPIGVNGSGDTVKGKIISFDFYNGEILSRSDNPSSGNLYDSGCSFISPYLTDTYNSPNDNTNIVFNFRAAGITHTYDLDDDVVTPLFYVTYNNQRFYYYPKAVYTASSTSVAVPISATILLDTFRSYFGNITSSTVFTFGVTPSYKYNGQIITGNSFECTITGGDFVNYSNPRIVEGDPSDPSNPVGYVPSPKPPAPVNTWDPSNDDEFNFNYFVKLLDSLKGAISGIPSFVAYLFGFLPKEIIEGLYLMIMVCIIMRIIGR